MQTISETLASWVADLDYTDIPPDLVESARQNILDILGCGLFGSTRSWVQTIANLVMDWGGAEEATLWGHKRKLPCVNAVLANTNAVNSFEFDDTYFPWGIHPGALVVTAGFASAERMGNTTGKEFLTAVVAGHEVSERVRSGLGWSILHGWNGTALCSTFGAAVASSQIMRLDAEQISHALGIAGTYVGGLLTYGFEAMAKRVVNAKSAQGGIFAALLAEKGYTGYRDIFESKQGGFCSSHSSDPSFEKITKNLGIEYGMGKLALKKYPTCTSFHAVVDALSGIEGLKDLSPDDIEKVTVKTTSGARKNDVGLDYSNISSAQMSMPYTIAARLCEGEVGIHQFTEAKVQDPALRRMAERVEIVTDSDLDSRGLEHRLAGKASIILKGGGKIESPLVLSPRRMDRDELITKFMTLATTAVSRETASRIATFVGEIEKKDNVVGLAQLLRG